MSNYNSDLVYASLETALIDQILLIINMHCHIMRNCYVKISLEGTRQLSTNDNIFN